jgi:hypothetical protein
MNRRHRLRLIALSSLVFLFACTRSPAPEGQYLSVTLERSPEVVAARVVLHYDPAALVFESVESGVLAHAYDDGRGEVVVGLLGEFVQAHIIFRAFREGESVALDEANTVAYTQDEAEVPGGVRLVGVMPGRASAVPADNGLTALRASSVTQPLELLLEPGFVNYTLGDITASGSVDVLDVVRIMNIAVGRRTLSQSGDWFEWYHADLNSDGAIDVQDVKRALVKAVDPSLPPNLQVAPRVLTFNQFYNHDVPVLVGNAGREPLSVSASREPNMMPVENVTPPTSVAGQRAYRVSYEPNRNAWRNGVLTVRSGSDERTVPIGNITLLITGQSNASGRGALGGAPPGIPQVRMLGNDYVWKQAEEPMDSNDGQIDDVSRETATSPSNTPGHSFGVLLGKELHAATARHVYLIPAARGGTALVGGSNPSWQPNINDLLDRETLFGSANFRAQLAGGWVTQGAPGESLPPRGGPPTALVWYQGEAEAGQASHEHFLNRTNAVMNRFVEELNVPIVYVQLARVSEQRSTNEKKYFQRIREEQRRMETFYGDRARQRFYMVVAHDLPMIDGIHLDAEGQRELGRRIALAYREHVLGEAVNGTGPRLEALQKKSNTEVRVVLTREVKPPSSNYADYFVACSSIESDSLACSEGAALPIASVQRESANTILITLASPATGDVYIGYVPKHYASNSGTPAASDVVRDLDDLPLPAFGPLKVGS